MGHLLQRATPSNVPLDPSRHYIHRAITSIEQLHPKHVITSIVPSHPSCYHIHQAAPSKNVPLHASITQTLSATPFVSLFLKSYFRHLRLLRNDCVATTCDGASSHMCVDSTLARREDRHWLQPRSSKRDIYFSIFHIISGVICQIKCTKASKMTPRASCTLCGPRPHRSRTRVVGSSCRFSRQASLHRIFREPHPVLINLPDLMELELQIVKRGRKHGCHAIWRHSANPSRRCLGPDVAVVCPLCVCATTSAAGRRPC